MKKVLRSVQTFFPFLHDVRFSLKFLWTNLTRKPHEKDFEALRKFRPSEEQVFVDIGSNRGEAILSMLVASGQVTHIHGFEPNPEVFQKLKKYFRNNPKVELHNFGLGDKTQDFNLFIPYYRNWMFDGLSSFKYEAARDWLKGRLWKFDVKHLSIRELTCHIKTLDELSLTPYFIKIDVQGFELEVLKGAKQTLKNHTPILLIEDINEQITGFLEEFGYKFYYYEKGKFHRGTGVLNTFCFTDDIFLTIQKD